jgi:uncharacterized protein
MGYTALSVRLNTCRPLMDLCISSCKCSFQKARKLKAKLPIPLLWVLLFSASVALSQEHPTIAAQPNTVFASADGKFEAAPDTAVVQFDILAQAGTAKEAYEQASKAAERTREILRSNGLEPKAAEIGYYSIQPRYDWKNPTHKLIGYDVSANVSVKVKDFSKIGPITQQLADGAVSESQSVNYTLENIDAAKSKAVEDAYHRARISADSLAQAGGRALGALSYASVETFENVRPMPLARQMAMPRAQTEAAPPTQEFTPQNVTVTAHVNALFNLK